jgi:transcriptional regulator with XRE-family HTH domain
LRYKTRKGAYKMPLSASEKIRVILQRRGLTISDLARILETTQSNISGKLKRNNFDEKDLQAVSAALGCKYEIIFTMEDTKETI